MRLTLNKFLNIAALAALVFCAFYGCAAEPEPEPPVYIGAENYQVEEAAMFAPFAAFADDEHLYHQDGLLERTRMNLVFLGWDDAMSEKQPAKIKEHGIAAAALIEYGETAADNAARAAELGFDRVAFSVSGEQLASEGVAELFESFEGASLFVFEDADLQKAAELAAKSGGTLYVKCEGIEPAALKEISGSVVPAVVTGEMSFEQVDERTEDFLLAGFDSYMLFDQLGSYYIENIYPSVVVY